MLLDAGRGFLRELGRRNWGRELLALFQPGSQRIWDTGMSLSFGQGVGNLGKCGGKRGLETLPGMVRE